MKRTRAYRRHQFWRALARAKRFLHNMGWGRDNERTVHLFAKTRRPCSCWMCRNEKYNRQHDNKDVIEEEMRGYSEMGSR